MTLRQVMDLRDDMTKQAIALAAVLLFAGGCSGNHPNAPAHDTASCFGIPCEFSGKLTAEQERSIPSGLRGAFYVESLRPINKGTLAQELKHKEKLAEEVRDGATYVALKDYRCVEFGSGVSGMMIVVERYRIEDR